MPHLSPQDWAVFAVFGLVYLGMFLGGLPKLKLDRSGVALLGAIAVIALREWSVEQAAAAVDLPTVVLLFAFMVVSAQLRLAGFYARAVQVVGRWPLSPRALLAAWIALSASLSAVFSNDVICLAMTPMVIYIARQRQLPVLPFLLALSCAANIGSAGTIIGNPQNMLIGSVLHIPFADYLYRVAVPVLLSLVLLWAWLSWACSGLWASAPASGRHVPMHPEASVYDPAQTFKGLLVAVLIMVAFIWTDWPRPVVALVGAAVLLLSRKLHSARAMGFVDWQLLILFNGLFIVNHALQQTGVAAQAVQWLQQQGVHIAQPGPLMALSVTMANVVSNVPSVMLLLPHLQGNAMAGSWLALVSTFAGNLLLVGSIANIIVADLAREEGIRLDWRTHARVGVPVTLLSLLCCVWLWPAI